VINNGSVNILWSCFDPHNKHLTAERCTITTAFNGSADVCSLGSLSPGKNMSPWAPV